MDIGFQITKLYVRFVVQTPKFFLASSMDALFLPYLRFDVGFAVIPSIRNQSGDDFSNLSY